MVRLRDRDLTRLTKDLVAPIASAIAVSVMPRFNRRSITSPERGEDTERSAITVTFEGSEASSNPMQTSVPRRLLDSAGEHQPDDPTFSIPTSSLRLLPHTRRALGDVPRPWAGIADGVSSDACDTTGMPGPPHAAEAV